MPIKKEKNKIFNIKNTITNNNYLFVGSFSEIDSIVNKINNVGISSITQSEKTLVSKYVNIKLITPDTKLVKALINMNDTIDIIKKKIMVYCGYHPKHQHLWVNTKDISEYEKRIIKKQSNFNELCSNKTITCQKITMSGYQDILGMEYRHNNIKQIIPCNLSKSIIKHSHIYTFVDLSHYLLQHYNNIKDNTIYLTDYKEFTKDPPDNIEYIEHTYFPFIKKYQTTTDNYSKIIRELVKTENILQDATLDHNPNETIYTNLVFYSKQEDIDVYRIFITINLDDNVSFCKYKSRNTNESYKLFNPETKKKRVNNNFRNATNYIVKYQPDLYSYPIEKKLLENWTQTELSLKEKINKKIENETDFNRPKEDELLLKIKYEDNYYDIHIYKNKVILRLLDIKINDKGISKVLDFTNSILEKIEKKIIHFKKMDLISTDFSENINDKKLSFLKLNNNLTNYSSHVYKITPEEIEKNKIYINYKKVNQFTSFDNIRRYFLKIKQDNNLSVSNFKKTWINETNKLFNLSETDSIEFLSVINETLDSEELKKKPMDIDIHIVISFNYDENKEGIYNISVKNCDSFQIMSQVKQFIYYVFQDSKKSRIKAPKEDKLVFEIKETKMTEEDEFEMDDDFIDLDENNIINNNNNDNNNKNDNKNDNNNDNNIDLNNSTTDFEQVQLKRMSVRNYMSEMRKRDNKLLNFKSDSLKTYTKSCGAVDMRQPIIITKQELTNFEKRNPVGYKTLTYIEWGSSSKNKNYFICPRIWCIRDKIALSDEQLIDNNGKCPFCEGEIIDSKGLLIEGNKTIIIRRGGSNMFWEDKKIQSKKSKEWKKYLEGTEKDAYPGFLDPKLHPKNMCMPCCFKKGEEKARGIEKCAVADIYFTTDENIEPEDLVIGKKIDGEILKENDTFLLKNTKNKTKNNVYIVTKNGAERYGKITKLDLFLGNGFIINIIKGKHKNKQFNAILKKGNFSFEEKINKSITMEDKYVLGEDKFPIEYDKMGVIYNKLDKILNGSDIFIEDSRLKGNTSMFIRKGVIQNRNTSFLSAIGSLMKMSAETLVKHIIENLDPKEFIGLNNGDLLKLFSVSEDKIEINDSLELILYRWCTEYPDFFYFFINKKRIINPPSLKIQMDILKKKNRYRTLLAIFIAFENFKKYCGDMNIPKDPILFRGLLAQKNDWFFKKGLNIIIFEKVEEKKDLLYVECPVYKNMFNDSYSICMLYKYKQYYEPIAISNNKENTYVPEFIKTFNRDKINYTNEKLINIAYRLYYIVKNQCEWKYDESIYSLYNTIKYKTLDSIYDVIDRHKIKYYITDEYYKGIGVMLENKTVLFTRRFGINTSIQSKKISEIELLDYDSLLKIIGDRAVSVILKKKDIFAIGLDNGNFHPIIKEEYSKKKHKLEVLGFNYEFELHGMENKNNVSKFISNYSGEQAMYINLKNEIKSFFSTRNRNISKLRTIIKNILTEKDIHLKRDRISNIVRFIVSNIMINNKPISTRKNTKPCNRKSKKKCKEICGLSPSQKKQGIILGDLNLEFSFSNCKLNLPRTIKEKFVSRLTEEILFSLGERDNILFGKYYSDSDTNKNIIVEGEDYIDYINQIFDVKNMYLSGYTTPGMWPLTLGKPKHIEIDRDFVKILETEPPKQIQVPQIHKNELQNNIYPDREGSKYNKHGKELKDTRIKEGKCIFPFRKKTNGLLYTDCIHHQNIDNGTICATEVDKDNIMTKYGFCSDSKCSSTIFATDTDYMGVKRTESDVKSGRCCFPFKEKIRNGKKIEYKEQHECIESKSGRGPICATGVYDKDIPNRMKIKTIKKGQMKTYGYCPVNKQVLNTKKGHKCVLPFSHNKKFYNRCINWEKGKVCPIRKDPSSKIAVIGKKRGVDFDYCVDEDIGGIDQSKWEFKEGTYLAPPKGASILKSDIKFKTVLEAMAECSKNKFCKGITDDFNTNKITMRFSATPRTSNNFIGNSWIKK